MPTAALIAGTGLSAGGQILQGFQTRAADKAIATQQEQAGQVEATNANAQISANDAEARRAIGGVTAGAAAGGVSGSSGSAGVVKAYDASQAMVRDTYLHYQGQLAERGAYFAAKTTRWEGDQALLTGLQGAGSTALTGYFNYSLMKKGGSGSNGPPLTSGGTVK